MTVRMLFAWYDLWIGIYWDRAARRLYVLPLPCVGIVVQFACHAQPAAPDRDTKIPRLMYWEDSEGFWSLTPDLVENIIDVEQFTHDGDEISISFKRMDLSEDDMDAMPEC